MKKQIAKIQQIDNVPVVFELASVHRNNAYRGERTQKTDREIRLLHTVDLLKAVWSYDYEKWGRSNAKDVTIKEKWRCILWEKLQH